MQLGAVEADSAELELLHFARQLQHLEEDAGHLVQEAATEAGQGVVIRLGGAGIILEYSD